MERLLWAASFLVASCSAWAVVPARSSSLGGDLPMRPAERAVWLAIGAMILGTGVVCWTHLPARVFELAASLVHRHEGHHLRRLAVLAAKLAAAVAGLLGIAALVVLSRAAAVTRLAFAVATLLVVAVGLRALSFRFRLLSSSSWGPFVVRDLINGAGLIGATLLGARAAGWLTPRRGRSFVMATCLVVPLAALAASAAGAHHASRSGGRSPGLDRAFAEGVGGGFADVGPVGEYFAAPDLEGHPAFVRRDVRIDFDWSTSEKPGGSTSPGFADVSHDRFSVRWQGAVVARFTEPYTFEVDADEGARLWIRDGESWRPLVDGWRGAGVRRSAPWPMTAGRAVEFKLEYRQTGGPAHVRLAWSSANTPREVVDTLSHSGTNVDGVGYARTAIWADAMKGGRDVWTVPKSEEPVPLDRDGWPLRDAENIVFEGAKQTRGSYRLSFEGRARVGTWPSVTFLVAGQVVGQELPAGAGYDPRTNVTTAEMRLPNDEGLLAMRFLDTRRTATAKTGTGVRAVSLMRPIRPGAERSAPRGAMFLDDVKRFYADGFTTIRWILNFDKEADWKERLAPSRAKATHEGEPIPWEYVVQLANETGRDLYLSTPVNATEDYLRKLAQLIRHGSGDDGLPYSAAQKAPRFPPLNSNLRLYLERSNEIWNWGFSQAQDNLRQVREAVAAGTPEALIVNYDHSVSPDHGSDLWLRWHALQTKRLADLFGDVFGPGAIGRRVRVLYEYQYNDFQGTASGGLTFLQRYFDNLDGAHVRDPKPVAAYLWGAGAATYYGSGNGSGKQEAVKIPDAGFEKPPGASPWTFRGLAGTYRAPPLLEALAVRDPGAAAAAKGVGVGIKFTVGPKPLAVYAVGRLREPGDKQPHTVRIVRLSDRSILGDRTIEPDHAAAGPAIWAPLPHAVLLAPNTAYAIVSEESPEGDQVHAHPRIDAAAELHVDGGLVIASGAPWDAAKWQIDPRSNDETGPVSFRFAPAPADGRGAPPAPIEGKQAAFIEGKGSIETTIDFGKPGSYGVQFAAAARQGGEPNPIDFYLDDQRITACSGGRDPRVCPEPFQGGSRWAYDAHDLLPYTTTAVHVGGPHHLRIVGRGGDKDAVYLDDLRVVSTDALFEGGIPAAGQATGEVAIDDYRKQLNEQARYPSAFGLHTVAYEGGWSIGGDFTATAIQAVAKYLDPRAKLANDQAQEAIAAAGYALNVWGTYDQWPTAFETLDHAFSYPLVASIREGNNRLWSTAGAAQPIPAAISPAAVTWAWPGRGHPGELTHPGDLASYDVFTPTSRPFDLTLETVGAGQTRFSVDGGLTFSANGPTGRTLQGKGVVLTAGRHTLTVESLDGDLIVRSLAVEESAAPR